MKFTNIVDTMKNRISSLSWIKVERSLGYTTDLKSWAVQPVELADGYYVLEDLKHGLIFPVNTLEGMEEKFPKIPEQPKEWVPINSDQAWSILDAVSCVSDDETRYYMNGVYIDTDGHVVSTDGRRLFVEKCSFPSLLGGNIIPIKSALKRFLKPDRKRGRLEGGIADKWIWFRHGQEILSLETIEGQFPNWKRVYPDEQNYKEFFFEIPPISILNQVSYLESRGQRLFIYPDGSVKVENPESNKDRMTLGNVSANVPSVVCVMARFLKDALRQGGNKALVSSLDNGTNKALIVELPSGAKQIIMPMMAE